MFSVQWLMFTPLDNGEKELSIMTVFNLCSLFFSNIMTLFIPVFMGVRII